MPLLIGGAVLLCLVVACGAGIWILGGYLQLKSPDLWVFRGGFSVLGILAAAGYIWWYRSRRPAAGGHATSTGHSNRQRVA